MLQNNKTYKCKFHFDELKCQKCGTEAIEKLNGIDYILNVYIDFDNGDITIEAKKQLSKFEITKLINEIVLIDHPAHHNNLNTISNIIVEEFNFEDIDCPNCALKVEKALNKNNNIIEAKVNFINKKIIIKHLNNVEVFNIASKIVKSVESDAKLYKKDELIDDKENKVKKTINLALLITGFISFLIIVIINKGFNINNIYIYLSYWLSYLLISYSLIFEAFHGIIHKDFFNENILMIVASVGALIINEPIEGIMVILLYKIGEFFQDLATNKSKNAIKSLIEMKADTVTLSDGTIKNIKDVNIGEIITIHVGEQIPLDGIIKNGETNIDMKTLTGESAPVFATMGEEILSGSINLTRVIDVEVTKKDSDSTISKVLKLVEEASNQKSKSEQFITKFARIYTPIVLVLAILIGGIQGFVLHQEINVIFNNIFTLLVISCPCALVISIPLGYFSGIGRCSASGILVKGGNFLEALSKVKTFVFDKTGTITKGNFVVSKINPVDGYTAEEVLRLITLVEQYSLHPIANSIKAAYNQEVEKLTNATVEEISGAGLHLSVKKNNIQKDILVGNNKLMQLFNIKYTECNDIGTILYLSVNSQFLGSLVITDEIKESSLSLIDYLNKHQYKSIMLTGDNEAVAKDICQKVGINKYFAKILPQEKYDHLKSIIKDSKGLVCYVGDGINDTPSLKLADVGISMGKNGSDSAKECADIVIMNDDLSKIEEAIAISKFTKMIIIENIVFALLIKLFAIVLGISGILGSIAMLVALFADVGVCLLAILNVLRILKFKQKTISKN